MSDGYPQLRRTIRTAVSGSIPAENVDEVVDLAIHGMDQGFRALLAVVKGASSTQISVCATSIALSIVAEEAAAKLQTLVSDASDNGFKVRSAVVQMGGGNG